MTAALTVAAAVVLSASLLAQAKPNFSGKWVIDAEKTAAANPNAGGGGGGGRMGGGMGAAPVTITMDATTFKMERTIQDNVMTTTYKLDGSESKNMGMGRGGQTEQISKVTIEGNKMVVKTQGQNGEQVTSWYMDGDWLVSERTTQNGAQKTYYKKAS
jgi:hypothetical protein